LLKVILAVRVIYKIIAMMKNMVEHEYITPEVQVYVFQPEGVLCASEGNENVGENEGSEWD
jgi:hypothetical protein